MTEARPKKRFSTTELKKAFGHFGTGVAVITGQSDCRPYGFTCQSVVALSMDPTYIAFAPDRSSTTWPRIRPAGAICVNILTSNQEAVGRTFADRNADRFAQVSWQPGANGAPALTDVLARFEADVVNEIEIGDHTFVIAAPTDIWFGAGRAPLLYYRGAFRCPHEWATADV